MSIRIVFLFYVAIVFGLLAIEKNVSAAEEKGAIKVGGLAQAWVVDDTSSTAAKPNFRLRRAELKLSAQATEDVKFFIMADPAKAIATTSTTVVTATTPATTTTTVKGVNTSGDTKILQDLGVTVSLMSDLDVTLGQFKTPTSAEGLESSAELLLPERSIVGRTFGDKREPGGMITYKYSDLKAMLMFSNGQAVNVDDIDNDKDVTFRLEYALMPEIKLGVFTQAANFSYGERARHGLNVRYQSESNYASAEWGYQSIANNTTKTMGVVVDVAHTYQKWQGVGRFEYLRPDSNADLAGKAFTLGVNYLFDKKVKAQVAGTYLIDMVAPNGTPSVGTSGSGGTVFYLAFSAGI